MPRLESAHALADARLTARCRQWLAKEGEIISANRIVVLPDWRTKLEAAYLAAYAALWEREDSPAARASDEEMQALAALLTKTAEACRAASAATERRLAARPRLSSWSEIPASLQPLVEQGRAAGSISNSAWCEALNALAVNEDQAVELLDWLNGQGIDIE